jgi:hypothetical protein
MILFLSIVYSIIWVVVNYYFYIKKKYIGLTIIMSLIGVGIWFYVINASMPDSNDYSCIEYVAYKSTVIDNKVVINKMNVYEHMIGDILILKNLQNANIDTLYCQRFESVAYDVIKIGDTLFKKANNDSIFKIDSGKAKLIDVINCGCDTNIYMKKHSHSPNMNDLKESRSKIPH